MFEGQSLFPVSSIVAPGYGDWKCPEFADTKIFFFYIFSIKKKSPITLTSQVNFSNDTLIMVVKLLTQSLLFDYLLFIKARLKQKLNNKILHHFYNI